MNNNFYVLPTKPNEIFHYGVAERSGRYKWGSGDRPYQRLEGAAKKTASFVKGAVKEGSARRAVRKEARRQKNLKIGTERLNNRISKANSEADRLSRKMGWKNTEKAGKEFKRMENVRDVSNSILSDEERTIQLGKYTRLVRNVIVGTTAIGAVAAGGGIGVLGIGLSSVSNSSAILSAIVTSSAIAAAGSNYYEKTKY